MQDWKKVVLDEQSMWPSEGRVELEAPHVDARGSIQSLVNFPMKNLSLISSKKGTLRSNHYHMTDWHYMYVLSGAFDYYYRPAGSSDKPSTDDVVDSIPAGSATLRPSIWNPPQMPTIVAPSACCACIHAARPVRCSQRRSSIVFFVPGRTMKS